MDEKLMYQIKEAAEILNVSYPWLDRKIRDGVINIVWFGGQRMMSKKEIGRIVENGVK